MRSGRACAGLASVGAVLHVVACADRTDEVDVLVYVDFITEQVEQFDGFEFQHVFVLEARFTEPTDAQRSVDIDDRRFYRSWHPTPEERETVRANGYEFCSIGDELFCPGWNRERDAAMIAMGIPERLGTQDYRLPYTWAVRLGGAYRHSGAGYVDVRRLDENGERWRVLQNQRLWLDH